MNQATDDMDNRKQQLDDFFNEYASRFNHSLKGGSPDVEGTMASFAGCFVEASPSGVICGQNDQQFRNAIPQGHAFYKNIGITSMDILSKEITLLDNFHSMNKILWRSAYTKQNGTQGGIEFEVVYFVQSRENSHRIFAYITGDEHAALKEHGLV